MEWHFMVNCNSFSALSSRESKQEASCLFPQFYCRSGKQTIKVSFFFHYISLCSKVLAIFQLCLGLLAGIYSGARMNLLKILCLHDLHIVEWYPSAVLLSNFSSPLKLMLMFYDWICSCLQIGTWQKKSYCWYIKINCLSTSLEVEFNQKDYNVKSLIQLCFHVWKSAFGAFRASGECRR